MKKVMTGKYEISNHGFYGELEMGFLRTQLNFEITKKETQLY